MLLPRPGADPRDTGYLSERDEVYRQLIEECEVSRANRKSENKRRRQIALTGSDTSEWAKYNKIKELLLECTADTYSCDLVRFDANLPIRYGEKWLDETDALRLETHRVFHDSDAGLIFGLGAWWARVYGMSIFKVYSDRNEAVIDLINDPADIGVINEATHKLERQEAICHWYEMSLPAFRRLVQTIPNAALREQLIAEAGEHGTYSDTGALSHLGRAMSSIILASASPNMIGVANMAGGAVAEPRVEESVVKCAELWVWDDEATEACSECHRPQFDITHSRGPAFAHTFEPGGGWMGDYRKVTCFMPTERIITSMGNPLLPGEHPFYGLSVHPTPGFLWGLSQVDELYPLQCLAEERMRGIKKLLDKQVDPPITATNVSGVAEEKLRALRNPGGTFNTPNAGAEVKPFVVPTPPEAYADLDKLYEYMDHVAGRRSRKRDPNQRSGDQLMVEAQLSAGQTLDEAMRVEDALEAVVTAMMRTHRMVSGETLAYHDTETDKESEFYLSQIPGDFTIEVISHSASPVFSQQVLSKVAFAAQQKALDKDELIELLQLPHEHRLKYKARRRGKKEGEAQGKVLDLKTREIESRIKSADAKTIKALSDAEKH